MQVFEAWKPISEVPEFLAGVFVAQPHSGRVTVACDGKFAGGKLLVLHFNTFEALAVHEEFAHQWPGVTDRPVLPKSEGGYWTHPFLVVSGSAWARQSEQARIFDRVPTHYVILSAGDIVDVLALEPPRLKWTTVDELESALLAIERLGGA